MGVEVCAVGGFGEVGKNMTAIKVDDEVVICDMGLHMPNYIKYTEEEGEDIFRYDPKELRKVGAIPDDSVIKDWKDKVIAIIPGHAHLDHVGAVPYMANEYDCPIVCTPFTAAVLSILCKDEKIRLKNPIKRLLPNATMKLSKNITVEFINITHSTPQCVMVAMHTKYGVIVYATDFKLDNNPTLGPKPNYEAMDRMAKKGVSLAIIDALYAPENMKTPSESVAREMLKDVLLGVDARGKAIIVSTFSSHIARLKSIIECARLLKRKVAVLGRSLAKYISAAEEVGMVKFSDKAEICKYARQVRKKLKEIEKNKDKYLIIATGHQGEPKSVLSKMTDKILPFKFEDGDIIVFSCKIIPTKINQAYREILDNKLKKLGCRLFTEIHVSGHGAREDIRDLITRLKPKHVMPVHGEKQMMDAFTDIAYCLGYKTSQIHPIITGQKIKLP